MRDIGTSCGPKRLQIYDIFNSIGCSFCFEDVIASFSRIYRLPTFKFIFQFSVFFQRKLFKTTHR